MANRIASPSSNGKASKTGKATPAKAKRAVRKTDDRLVEWSHFSVGMMALLSAFLNGYANAQTATVAWLGVIVGGVVPGIVFVLAKVAGKQFRRGHRYRAYFTAFAGGSLLSLSIWHCAISISLLTYGDTLTCHLCLSVLMAISIDLGLVACEIASLDLR